MTLLVVVLVILAALALLRQLRAYSKFREMELAIPGPPTLPLLGNALTFIHADEDTVFSVLRDKMWCYHYEVWRFSILGQLFVFVSNADDIEMVMKRRDLQDKSPLVYTFFHDFSRRGLVTLNGSEWRGHRRTLQRAFHQDVLDRYMDIFTEEADRFVRRLPSCQEQDPNKDLLSLTSRVFVRTALVGEVDDGTKEHIETFTKYAHLVFNSVIARAVQPLLWLGFAYNLTKSGREARLLKAKVDGFISGVISRRRTELAKLRADGVSNNAEKQRRTLIDILVDTERKAQDDKQVEMSDIEMMDEVKIFFAAAVETTVAVLGWTFKVLSVRPGIQERVHAEIVEQLAGKEALTSADVNKLKYTEQVLKETMRLLPSVPLVARAVHEETEFSGHQLPAHSILLPNIYGCHRDPAHWPDPLRFDPDRFSPEECAKRHPYAYLPFSAGMRNCIGGRYAMMVMKSLLARLVPRYRVDPIADGHTEPADFPYAGAVSSYMPGGARVVFTPRPTPPPPSRVVPAVV